MSKDVVQCAERFFWNLASKGAPFCDLLMLGLRLFLVLRFSGFQGSQAKLMTFPLEGWVVFPALSIFGGAFVYIPQSIWYELYHLNCNIIRFACTYIINDIIIVYISYVRYMHTNNFACSYFFKRGSFVQVECHQSRCYLGITPSFSDKIHLWRIYGSRAETHERFYMIEVHRHRFEMSARKVPFEKCTRWRKVCERSAKDRR